VDDSGFVVYTQIMSNEEKTVAALRTRYAALRAEIAKTAGVPNAVVDRVARSLASELADGEEISASDWVHAAVEISSETRAGDVYWTESLRREAKAAA